MKEQKVKKLLKHEKGRKHRKRKRSDTDLLEQLETLLRLAAVGDAHTAEAFLDRHDNDVLQLFDAEGSTPLHEASRRGNLEVVQCFLRHGADARAETFNGNTPAHFAAERGHLLVLTALLQADRPAKIDARNLEGVTVHDLAEKAMQREDTMEGESLHSKARTEEWARRTQAEQDSDEDLARVWGREGESAGEGLHSNFDADLEWEERMRYEQELDGDPDSAWTSYSGPFGAAAPDQAESEDAYARRLWEQMEGRKRASSGASAAARQTWGAADEAAARRQANAKAAEERSRAILDEERAKDAAWRQALQQGAAGARRAAYEARWHAFGRDVASGKANIRLAEVPWPADRPEDMQPVLLYGVSGPAEVRKRLRLELLRWHEDKFAKFKDRLATADAQGILDRVKAMAQLLNSLSAQGAP